MCRTCAFEHARGAAATRRACTTKQRLPLLTDQCTRLCIGLSPVIGGDGLFSFNYKLAVLVSEADVQIKKVRHARLILVNLPLHISPACQLLCDSNHHRHMPLLCEPPPTTPTLFFLCRAVVDFLPGLPIIKDQTSPL